MTALLSKLSRWILQIVAGLVIVLALLVGVVRLLLPEAADFTDDIKAEVRDRSGYQVDFGHISAGISIYGPELRLSQTTIKLPDGQQVAVAEEAAVSLDLFALLSTGKLAPGRVYVEGISVDVQIDTEGVLLLQGRPLSDYVPGDSETEFDPDKLPEGLLQLTDVAFSFQDRKRDRPQITGQLKSFSLELDNGRLNLAGEVEPGGDLGDWLELEGEIPLALLLDPDEMDRETPWELRLRADDFRLDPWLRLADLSDIPVIDSEGSVDAAVEFRGLVPIGLAAELDIERLQLAQPQGPPTTIDIFEGRLAWRKTEGGWDANGERLVIGRLGRIWPSSSFTFRYLQEPDESAQSVRFSALFLRLEDLMPFVQAVASEQLIDAGVEGSFSGDVEKLRLNLSLVDKKPGNFDLALSFSKLGYKTPGPEFDLSGFTGSVQADQDGGNLKVESRKARFGVAKLFRHVLDIDSLDGLAIWRVTPDGYRVLADGVQVETPVGVGQASFELNIDPEFKTPLLDISGTGRIDDAAAGKVYLPNVLPDKVTEWLEEGIIGGRVPHAEFKIDGPLLDFPFDKNQGVFYLEGEFEDAVLDYAPGWPVLRDASGALVFDGVSMHSSRNRLNLAGIRLENVTAHIEDLRDGIVELEGGGRSDADKLLRFLQQTPAGKNMGPVFARVRAEGPAEASVKLILPVLDIDQWQLDGEVTISDASGWLDGIDPRFTDLNGTGRVHNTDVTASGVTGKLLDEALQIDVLPTGDPAAAYSHRVTVSGNLQVDKAEEALHLPETPFFTGKTPAKVTALFPVPNNPDTEFRLLFESRLEGVTSLLPAPVDKAAAEREAVQLKIRFPETGVIDLNGALERGIGFALRMREDEDGWQIDRSHFRGRGELPELPDRPGTRLSGYVDSVDIAEWVAAFSGEVVQSRGRDKGEPQIWQHYFSQADVQIGELYALNHRFVDVDARVDFNERSWDIYVAGPWLEGLVELPYDFTGSLPAELALERALLIEPVEEEGSEDEEADYAVDPRELPAIRGSIDDFAIGNLRLGKLELDVRRNQDGLRSTLLNTNASSFSTEMSADWTVVDKAQRSRLHVELVSTDMADTLQKLGYTPLISAESAKVVADFLWEGGPGLGIVYESTGELELEVKDGVVNEVDPAGGRILGLLSVAALPRRLALDFSELTADGLKFNRIQGKFRMDFGDAWTCNLGLEGPVADMGIVGRTGAAAQDYDQVAVVKPHVSQIMPAAGYMFGGPAVGGPLLLITQFFKKPLSGIGENYYKISGSWDEPVINQVERSELDTTAYADCEDQLPTLSPEEIEAIKGLITGEPEVAEEIDSESPGNEGS
ncbi:MAG: YhdP family protein [Gammaproteobacteria bacterium]|jgi:uncharacterized protein (TIGR02099 family)|nr:YhdP family protein [Gammaproteobacteria bacterium]MDP6616751.1 YhdP family protein [Gammaproteobacteria bacterium]MDP6695184.1 YhdP family protein [Gammaproteobacteria bacterium]